MIILTLLNYCRVQEGIWQWHNEEWWSRFSSECRDFISRLLVLDWYNRLDVKAALEHPWLARADKIYMEEQQITTDRLRNYYNLYRLVVIISWLCLHRLQ